MRRRTFLWPLLSLAGTCVEAIRFGMRSRRVTVTIVLLAGLLMIAIGMGAGAAVPFLLYPLA